MLITENTSNASLVFVGETVKVSYSCVTVTTLILVQRMKRINELKSNYASILVMGNPQRSSFVHLDLTSTEAMKILSDEISTDLAS